MIHCWKCKTDKEEDEFNWENKKLGKRKRICRSCMKVYHQHWYRKSYKHSDSRKRSISQQGEKIKRARYYVTNYLRTHPCVNCGDKRLPVLDFDHIIKTEKYNRYTRISFLVKRGYSIHRIDEEIAKCQVLCANCHRMKTAKEQGWYKSSNLP